MTETVVTLRLVGLRAWSARLDDRVIGRRRPNWTRRGQAAIGSSALVIFGGGLIIRLCFRSEFHASGWILGFYAGMATMGLLLLISDKRHRR